MEETLRCVQCKTNYSSKSNLKKHFKKFHPEEVINRTEPDKNYLFSCTKCNRNFMHSRNLKFHMKKTHPEQNLSPPCPQDEQNKNNRNNKKCALCNYFSDRKSVLNHYKLCHGISIQENTISFKNDDEFNGWKCNLENETNSKFVIGSSKLQKKHRYTTFVCHRNGQYIPQGKSFRHLKIQGTCKIDSFCPANIKLKRSHDGKCEAHIVETHVGHQTELAHLNLTKTERENLAAKIASKVSFDAILDEVRNSTCDSDLKRLQLLTKKDLHNIKRCYNLSSSEHSNDTISVESWTNEMQSKELHEDELAIIDNLDANEAEASLKELSTAESGDFEEENLKVIRTLTELLQTVDSMTFQTELEVIKKCIAPINSTLAPLEVPAGSKMQ